MAEVETSPYAEDAALVERCLEGDKQAWIELVDRYRRLIYSIPIKMGLDPAEADEVFQDVCVRLLSRLDTLRDGRSLARWLMVTAQRRAWDRTAAERRYVEDVAAEARPEIGPGADDTLLEAERAQAVRVALEGLSEVCRELIDGLFFQDPPLSYEELGSQLGRPHGSLGPTRLRCLKSLRQRLGDGWR